MCEKYGLVYLKLRGLCLNSNIDTYWVTDTHKGLFKMHGIIGSEISYEFELNSWMLIVYSRPKTTLATSSLSYHTFVMGKSQWSVVNDTKGKTIF